MRNLDKTGSVVLQHGVAISYDHLHGTSSTIGEQNYIQAILLVPELVPGSQSGEQKCKSKKII